MASKTSVKSAPYDRHGNLMHFTSAKPNEVGTYFGGVAEWRPNEPFEATMTIATMHSGYSAKYVVLKDEHGHTYAMFVTDLIAALATDEGARRSSFGRRRWTISKRGQNYGVKILEEN